MFDHEDSFHLDRWLRQYLRTNQEMIRRVGWPNWRADEPMPAKIDAPTAPAPSSQDIPPTIRVRLVGLPYQ